VPTARRFSLERAHSEVVALEAIRTIALLGNQLPRQCGIAIFTSDLGEWIGREHPALDCFVYGTADTSIALATGRISELLAWLDEHGS
jgi:hypothetical protein